MFIWPRRGLCPERPRAAPSWTVVMLSRKTGIGCWAPSPRRRRTAPLIAPAAASRCMKRPVDDRGDHDAVDPVMAKARIGHFVEAQGPGGARRRRSQPNPCSDPVDEANYITSTCSRSCSVVSRGTLAEASAAQRGAADDADEGRGRHRQHRRGRPPVRHVLVDRCWQGRAKTEPFVAAKGSRRCTSRSSRLAADGAVVVGLRRGGNRCIRCRRRPCWSRRSSPASSRARTVCMVNATVQATIHFEICS